MSEHRIRTFADRPILPGETIREKLAARGWTQADLAAILDRPASAVNAVITGKRRISPRLALDLAAAFDTSPEFWLDLETRYRLAEISG